MKYAVIHAATKQTILSGVGLGEASRFCQTHRGYYFAPLHV